MFILFFVFFFIFILFQDFFFLISNDRWSCYIRSMYSDRIWLLHLQMDGMWLRYTFLIDLRKMMKKKIFLKFHSRWMSWQNRLASSCWTAFREEKEKSSLFIRRLLWIRFDCDLNDKFEQRFMLLRNSVKKLHPHCRSYSQIFTMIQIIAGKMVLWYTNNES